MVTGYKGNKTITDSGIIYAPYIPVTFIHKIYKEIIKLRKEYPEFTGCIFCNDEGIIYRGHLKNGWVHNEHGPAIVSEDGHFCEWFIEGNRCSEEKWKQITREKKLDEFLQ